MNTLIHGFVSGVPDTTDPLLVGSVRWNAGHKFTGGTHGAFLFRDTGDATFGADWLTAGAAGALLVGAGAALPPTWQASPTLASLALSSPLGAASGGTGQSSYTIGDTLYASGATTLSKRAAVADGNVFRSAGIGAAPIWGKVRLSGSPTDITGILAPANGGTGFATYAVGDLLLADTTSTLARLAAVAGVKCLVTTAAGVAPTWSLLDYSAITGSFTTGDLLYALNGTSLTRRAAVAVGSVLASAGVATAPVWSDVPTLTDLTLTGKLVVQGANGAKANVKTATTTVNAAAGGTITASNFIPAGSLVLALLTRVTTAFGVSNGLTSIDIGDGTDVDRWGATQGIALDATSDLGDITIASPVYYPTATSIVITGNGGTGFDATGQIRLVLIYIDSVAPTS